MSIKALFETNAKQFVQNEFNFKQTQVVSRSFKYDPPQNMIDFLLLGKDLSEEEIDSLKLRMKKYKLYKTNLRIRQGLSAKQEIDLSQIKASILEDVFKKQKERDTLPSVPPSKLERPIPDIKSELKALYPALQTFSLTNAVVTNVDSSRKNTVTIFVGKFNRFLNRTEQNKLNDWMRVRIKTDSLKLIVE